MPPYKYHPLEGDEIRVLRLSSKRSGSLRIKLGHKSLSPSSPPHYAALSYTWGSTDTFYYITVETDPGFDFPESLLDASVTVRADHLSNYISPRGLMGSETATQYKGITRTLRSTIFLAVTFNLAEALLHLQCEDEERILWIDAICINQNDLAERGKQVQRMAEIYKLAHQTLVWLGPEDRNSSLALIALAQLASTVDVDYVTEEVYGRQGHEIIYQESMSALYYDEKTRCSLVSLLRKPWFRRLWVWQEARANPDHTVVLLGGNSLPWRLLQKAVLVFNSQSKAPAETSELLLQAYQLCHIPSFYSMEDLLYDTRNSLCADSRDRVFALIGMLDSGRRLGIEGDYEKTVGEVYMDVVLRQLTEGGSLELFRHCQLSNRSADMPSWVPDWSTPSSSFTTVRPYATSLSAPAQAVYNGKDTLTVTGIKVDDLASSTSLEVLRRSTDCSWTEFASALLSLLSPSDDFELTRNGSALDILIRTLCRNELADEYSLQQDNLPDVENLKLFVLKSHQAKNKREKEERLASSDSTDTPPVNIERYQKIVKQSTHGSKLIWTKSGLFGIGLESSLPGDMICVVLGCRVPLILRWVSQTELNIVGECYFHAIMDGSLLLPPAPQPPINFRPIQQLYPLYGRYALAFINTSTGRVQVEDPRIREPLPPGWKILQHDNERYEQIFYHEEDDIRTWRDPRLLPDALLARGVNLEAFNLV